MIRVIFRTALIHALIKNNLICTHSFSIASSYVQNRQAAFISKLPNNRRGTQHHKGRTRACFTRQRSLMVISFLFSLVEKYWSLTLWLCLILQQLLSQFLSVRSEVSNQLNNSMGRTDSLATTHIKITRIHNHGRSQLRECGLQLQVLSLSMLIFYWLNGNTRYFLRFFFRENILVISVHINKIQQDATICWYLFTVKLFYMFRVLSHPSSGAHKTVTAASGTGHVTYQGKTFRQRRLIRPLWRKVVALIRDMTCTRSCGYSFMCSWWWVRWHPKYVE